jgi:GNAT superfamily N-acetyltransferase
VEQPPQRLAVAADAPAISALMRASIRAHFPRFYDPRHTESAARYIGELDMTLIEDGTYYVHDAGGEIVACGGWSRRGLGRAILERCERDAAAEGFTTLALMATLPGEPLYRAYGFREVDRTMVRLPDGTELAGVAMERPCG